MHKYRVLKAILFLHLIVACAICAQASARAIGYDNDITRNFFNALACRTQAISVGPTKYGALITGGLDQKYQYHFFELTSEGQSSAARVVFSSPKEILGFQTALNPSWTANNDFVVDLAGEVFDFDVKESFGNRPTISRQVSVTKYFPLMMSDRNVLPTIVKAPIILRSVAAGKELLSFDPLAGAASRTGINVESYHFILTNQNDLVRFRKSTVSTDFGFEVYDPNKRQWLPLPMPGLQSSATPLLLRKVDGHLFEIAALVGGYGPAPKRIVVLRQGSSSPRILAQGQIGRVAVAPSGRDVYGYWSVDGKFRVVADQRRTSGTLAWLGRFSMMDGLIDFAFLDDGNIAVVKRRMGADVADTAILADNNGLSAVAYDSCAHISRGVAKIIANKQSFLFLPEGRVNHRDELVIYLHGGPDNRIDANGSWISDFFSLSGYPVLAINYTGSAGNWLSPRNRSNLEITFGSDVADGVAFARRILGHRNLRLSIVADSFGSLVGLAAIASGLVRADAFVDISGVVNPMSLAANTSGLSNTGALGQYILQVAGDLKVDPDTLISNARSTRFLFIHGANDVTASRDDVEKFVAKFNSLAPTTPAQLNIVPEMYHEADTKDEYSAILRSIESFGSH